MIITIIFDYDITGYFTLIWLSCCIHTELYICSCIIIMQGTVRLLIEVEDYDFLSSNEHVDDIYATITLTPSSSFTLRRAYTGMHRNSRIELSFQLQCTNNFYGSNCTTHCVARNDNGGHYSCGSNGEMICLSGWSGSSSGCITRKFM